MKPISDYTNVSCKHIAYTVEFPLISLHLLLFPFFMPAIHTQSKWVCVFSPIEAKSNYSVANDCFYPEQSDDGELSVDINSIS